MGMLMVGLLLFCLNSLLFWLTVEHAFANNGAEGISLAVKDGLSSGLLGINLHPADRVFCHFQYLSFVSRLAQI